jgi:hypothetical protein
MSWQLGFPVLVDGFIVELSNNLEGPKQPDCSY